MRARFSCGSGIMAAMDHLYASYAAAWIFLNGRAAVSLGVAVAVIAAYLLLRPSERLRRVLIVIGIAAIAASVLVAGFLTLAQYQAWAASSFGKLLLPPHRSFGYFVSYVLDRYWLAPFLGTVLAGLWYAFAGALRRKSERYLDEGEQELTALLVFAAGWPDALVMAPLAAVALVVLSLFRMLVLKKSLTTLGAPFMIATLIAIAYAADIRTLLGY